MDYRVARPLILNASLHVEDNTEFSSRLPLGGPYTLTVNVSESSCDLTVFFKHSAKVRELRRELAVIEAALVDAESVTAEVQ